MKTMVKDLSDPPSIIHQTDALTGLASTRRDYCTRPEPLLGYNRGK
jgi:hypothetical protein